MEEEQTIRESQQDEIITPDKEDDKLVKLLEDMIQEACPQQTIEKRNIKEDDLNRVEGSVGVEGENFISFEEENCFSFDELTFKIRPELSLEYLLHQDDIGQPNIIDENNINDCEAKGDIHMEVCPQPKTEVQETMYLNKDLNLNEGSVNLEPEVQSLFQTHDEVLKMGLDKLLQPDNLCNDDIFDEEAVEKLMDHLNSWSEPPPSESLIDAGQSCDNVINFGDSFETFNTPSLFDELFMPSTEDESYPSAVLSVDNPTQSESNDNDIVILYEGKPATPEFNKRTLRPADLIPMALEIEITTKTEHVLPKASEVTQEPLPISQEACISTASELMKRKKREPQKSEQALEEMKEQKALNKDCEGIPNLIINLENGNVYASGDDYTRVGSGVSMTYKLKNPDKDKRVVTLSYNSAGQKAEFYVSSEGTPPKKMKSS